MVFLCGLKSDMTGTKATALEEHCRRTGRAFVRFDYFGHGQSSGAFEDGTMTRWAEDAVAVIDELTEGPQVLVGSSMGGWVMLLTAIQRPERIAGMVGIAAAPDFTEDLLWAQLSDEQRDMLEEQGKIEMPSDYDDEPYIISRVLIEDGRHNLLLIDHIPFDGPVRLLHGLRDEDVPYDLSLRIADKLTSEDVEVHFVKSGDHRLSTDDNLALLTRTVDEVCARVAGQSSGS